MKSTKAGLAYTIFKPFLVLLVVMSSVAGWYVYNLNASPFAKDPFYFQIDSVIVNLEHRNPRHYLKASPVVVTRHKDLHRQLSLYRPEIRNFLITQLRQESVSSLNETGSYERVRTEALEGIRELLHNSTGINSVDDLIFTEFVIQ